VGLGAGITGGLSLGKQLSESLNMASSENEDVVVRLQTLKRMLDEKLITEEEFRAKKKAILEAI
jgi:hypothetical protein